MKPAFKPINLDYLANVQKYCDARYQQPELGWDPVEEIAGEDTFALELERISASIEHIFEMFDRTVLNIGNPQK